jgi:hypothetical protein
MRQFRKCATQIMRSDSNPQFLGMAPNNKVDGLRAQALAEVAVLSMARNSLPFRMSAARVHRSRLSFAHVGIGAFRNRLPFPSISTITHLPSRFFTRSHMRLATSPRWRPQPISRASKARPDAYRLVGCAGDQHLESVADLKDPASGIGRIDETHERVLR